MCMTIYSIFHFLSCKTKPDIDCEDDCVYYNQIYSEKMERS
jgi:hypothetical protein